MSIIPRILNPIIAAFGTATVACHLQAAVEYQAIDLGEISDAISQADAISESSIVVGTFDSTQRRGAWMWDAGMFRNIGEIPGSGATDVNTAGAITVNYPSAIIKQPRAFSFFNGAFSELDNQFGGDLIVANSINENNEIVGSANNQAGFRRAYLLRQGNAIDLGTLGGTFSEAYAVNDYGQVAGVSTLQGDSVVRGFYYNAGAMQVIGTIGGTRSFAYGINNRGQVVGESDVRFDYRLKAFIWENGSIRDLGELTDKYGSGLGSAAVRINDRGQAVGLSGASAVLFRDGQCIELRKLLDENSGWWLWEARDINNKGEIVGRGSYEPGKIWNPANVGGQGRAYLLRPIVPLPLLDVELSVERRGDRIFLIWPSTATGFALQQTTSLESKPPVWTNVVETPQLIGSRYEVSVSPGNRHIFFQLAYSSGP